MRVWIWVLTLQFAIVSSAYAEVTVLHDTGNSEPIAPYMKPWTDVQKAANQRQRTQQQRKKTAEQTLANMFPIETPEMRVGPIDGMVMNQQLKARFVGTVFLVGADEHSVNWLQENKTTLKQRGAVGALVQAQSRQDMARVQTVGAGLIITPMSGTEFYDKLGITRYPVLISSEGFEQ